MMKPLLFCYITVAALHSALAFVVLGPQDILSSQRLGDTQRTRTALNGVCLDPINKDVEEEFVS